MDMDDTSYFMLVLAIALALLVGAVALPEPLNPALLKPPSDWYLSTYQRYFEPADSRGFASPQAVVIARLEEGLKKLSTKSKYVKLHKKAVAALRPTLSAQAAPSASGEPAAKFEASYDLPSGQLFAAWTSPSFALEGRFNPSPTLALRLPGASLQASYSAASGLISERWQVSRRLALLAEQGRHQSFGFELALTNF